MEAEYSVDVIIMPANIKFRCSIDEILTAVREKCGVTNVIIEQGQDIDGLIETLLGINEAHYTMVSGSRIDGTDIIVYLHSKDLEDTPEYFSGNDLEADALVKRYFAEEARELQNLISSKK